MCHRHCGKPDCWLNLDREIPYQGLTIGFPFEKKASLEQGKTRFFEKKRPRPASAPASRRRSRTQMEEDARHREARHAPLDQGRRALVEGSSVPMCVAPTNVVRKESTRDPLDWRGDRDKAGERVKGCGSTPKGAWKAKPAGTKRPPLHEPGHNPNPATLTKAAAEEELSKLRGELSRVKGEGKHWIKESLGKIAAKERELAQREAGLQREYHKVRA